MRWRIEWLALVSVSLMGCAGDLDDVERFLSFESNFLEECADTVPAALHDEARCAACHTEDNELGAGLDLQGDDVGTRLADVPGLCPPEPILDPADPQNSTLVRWVAGGMAGCESSYSKMPPLGQGMTPLELQCLLIWIDNLDGVENLVSEDDS
jgi:hypothetical protein